MQEKCYSIALFSGKKVYFTSKKKTKLFLNQFNKCLNLSYYEAIKIYTEFVFVYYNTTYATSTTFLDRKIQIITNETESILRQLLKIHNNVMIMSAFIKGLDVLIEGCKLFGEQKEYKIIQNRLIAIKKEISNLYDIECSYDYLKPL